MPEAPLTVSEVARRLGVSPRDITQLFYRRYLPDDSAPIFGGRRMVPTAMLPQIEQTLRDRGVLKAAATETACA